MAKSEVNVGLLGWGTVGTSVSKILLNHQEQIFQTAGVRLNLTKVVKRTLPAHREGINLPENCLSTNPAEVIENPQIDIVVELIGGIDQAHQLITQAIRNGKHVVTANKALLAERGVELFQLADKHGVGLGFEASTAGGIPIIKALTDSFPGNQIQAIYGIVNGTCNYILTQMHEQMTSFDAALSAAQDKGYAESDPTLDIEGIDAAHKLAILSSLAYNAHLPFERVHVEGITRITDREIQHAQEFGYVIKLLAITKKTTRGIEARVHPTLIPEKSILANVSDAFNAGCVVGDAVGPTLFYGRGAGGMPTASAVVADIVGAGRSASTGVVNPLPKGWITNESAQGVVSSIAEIETRYYLHLIVRDRPGVLAKIGQVLGQCNIGIAAVIQKESHGTDTASLVIITHQALENNMIQARQLINQLEVVSGDSILIRIEELDFAKT